MGFGSAGSGFDDQSVATAAVDAAVSGISASTEAILVLQATGGTLTADGNEQTLYIDDEPLGCFKSGMAVVDLDNMQAGDTTVLRVYYRIRDAGALQLWGYESFTGADGGLLNGRKLIELDLLPNRHGFQLTLQQTAGTNRSYDWELYPEM
jgi:hypothetical protein